MRVWNEDKEEELALRGGGPLFALPQSKGALRLGKPERMNREFHYRWEWWLRSSPEALWPLVSDTNRFDRDAGLPSVERLRGSDTNDRMSGHRVKTKLAGIGIEWVEKPFEWVKPQRFGVLREYRSGPIKKLRVLVELLPVGEGTQLVYQLWSEPRNLLGSLVIPIQAGIIAKRRFGETFRQYDKLASADETPAHVEIPTPTAHRYTLAPGGETRLRSARTALINLGLPPQLWDKLRQFITTADEMDLTHIRPYALADRWGVPRREVLNLCLHATRAGVLNLQWDVLCPLCRGAKESNPTLSGIHEPVHCESCNIDFNVNFDRSVELTFRPNPAVRDVVVREYCVGGPNVTPHIVAQQVLPSRTESELALIMEPGRYRVRSTSIPGGQTFVVVPDGMKKVEFKVDTDGWPNEEPRVTTRPIAVLSNNSEIEQLFLIERMAWTDQATTAAEVTALQVFRDLFSSEALRPGEQISVGSLAVLFTDLRDSTQLYRQIGDAPAFGRVMNHFDVLRRAIDAEGGAIVKTIGDAVMAVFHHPLTALKAVLSAQGKLDELGAPPLMLKAGIHTGACIAVTLNERLDYFGSTVNLSARIQRLSEGNDVVISDAMRRDPEVADFLEKSQTVSAAPFASPIKGFDEEHFKLWRVKRRDRNRAGNSVGSESPATRETN